jgi:hypothetical protein
MEASKSERARPELGPGPECVIRLKTVWNETDACTGNRPLVNRCVVSGIGGIFMTRKKLVSLAVICALGLVFTGLAQAQDPDHTYNVDLTVGTTGSVTGTITTNGAIGPLNLANILSFNLEMNDGSGLVDCASFPGNCRVFGQNVPLALSATPTELTWNFNAARSFLSFQDAILNAAPSGMTPCFNLTAGPIFQCGSSTTMPSGMALVTATGAGLISSAVVSEQNAGIQAFAPGNPSPVPEPSTILLYGIGLLLFGIIVGRKQVHTRKFRLMDVA